MTDRLRRVVIVSSTGTGFMQFSIRSFPERVFSYRINDLRESDISGEGGSAPPGPHLWIRPWYTRVFDNDR